MTTANSFLRSFAGGVIDEELFARLDLTKFQTGLAKAENFEIRPHGPAVNRAGLQWVIETKDSTKASVLIPFIYSSTQAYVLEFGDLYMRIHTAGGTVLNTAQNITAITRANPGVLTYVGADPTNGTWVYLSGIGGMTQLNGRYVKVANVNAGANTLELTDTAGNNINTTNYTAYTAGGTMAPVFEITTPYVEADLAALDYTQSNDVMTLCHPTYQQRQLARTGPTTWPLNTFTLAPTIATPTAPTVVAVGAGAINYYYVTTAVASGTLEESLPSAYGTCANDITVAGQSNTITTATVTGAVRYNVYKYVSGLYGYIGQTDGSAFSDNNITPDTTRTPPLANDPFVGAGNYPGAVGYGRGRRWFAGTTNKGQSLWGTQAGTESNMSYSIPSQDDDSISVRLTSQKAHTIRHIVPLSSELLLLTSGGEWKVHSGGGLMTPTTIDYDPEGEIGANDVQPAVTSRSCLYVQARGGHIREMKVSPYSTQARYETSDLSIVAPGLFDGYDIVSMALATTPNQTLFAVRDDGTLIGLTYVPEHEVSAWFTIVTNGEFESVAIIPEGSEDVLYAVVKRTLNGRTVRSVERKSTRRFATLADSYFLDAGSSYSGSATTTVTGLWHLEGVVVSILADGAVIPNQTVTNGSITLQAAASKVHVGLGYNCDLQTLPLSLEMTAFGQGTRKNVNDVRIRVKDTSGLFIGPSVDKLTEVKQRTTEPYGTPPALFTGVKDHKIEPSWADDARVYIRQPYPLPATVLGLVAKVAPGG